MKYFSEGTNILVELKTEYDTLNTYKIDDVLDFSVTVDQDIIYLEGLYDYEMKPRRQIWGHTVEFSLINPDKSVVKFADSLISEGKEVEITITDKESKKEFVNGKGKLVELETYSNVSQDIILNLGFYIKYKNTLIEAYNESYGLKGIEFNDNSNHYEESDHEYDYEDTWDDYGCNCNCNIAYNYCPYCGEYLR